MIANGIVVKNPVIVNQEVMVDFNVPKSIGKFFNNNRFYAEYDKHINLSKVPNSILIIPLLSNILPVAWFSGVDVIVEEIDETFFNILPTIQRSLEKLYPKLTIRSKLLANKIVKNSMIDSNKSAQLFSGGIDSIATYLRRIEEKPALFTIWGADVAINDNTSWDKVKNYNLQISSELDTSIFFIKSNFREILNTKSLGEEYKHLICGYHWWAGVQHGLGLTGLCAPINFAKEIRTLYIPSSDNIESNVPWGSHPVIDNEIKWANTEVIHDSFDINRQDKTKIIAKFIREINNNLKIRVCWENDHNGGNCNQCEKCCRTITALIVEGIDPNSHGFTVPINLFKYIKHNIVNGKWIFGESDKMYDWQDIQKHIPNNLKNADVQYRDLLGWLKKYNFENFRLPFSIKLRRNIGRFLPNSSKRFIRKIIN